MGRVRNKVVLVTGAASGLGAADARRLAAEGARVVLTDVNAEAGQRLAASLPGACFLHQDVRDERRWHQVVETVMAECGRLDALVNNAGLVQFGSLEDLSLDAFRLMQQVMVEGTFLGCRAALPALRASGGGAIVNVSSVGAIRGIGGIFGYAAAKGAILSMTRSVAIHCQDLGDPIRCNVILPGAHDTPMVAAARAAFDADSDAMKTVAQLGQPEDVASLVLFLVSDESRHINGAELVIDGAGSVR